MGVSDDFLINYDNAENTAQYTAMAFQRTTGNVGI